MHACGQIKYTHFECKPLVSLKASSRCTQARTCTHLLVRVVDVHIPYSIGISNEEEKCVKDLLNISLESGQLRPEQTDVAGSPSDRVKERKRRMRESYQQHTSPKHKYADMRGSPFGKRCSFPLFFYPLNSPCLVSF